MVKMISCFTFFNEIDLLKLRLSYEYNFYDNIVIVEATKTHAGHPKILYFHKYQHLFADYLDKIVYVVVDVMPEVIKEQYIGCNNLIAPEYRWHLEEHQRNCILRGLLKIRLEDNDLILINDLDEIVSCEKVNHVSSLIKSGQIHYFQLYDYRYSVALPHHGKNWLGGYMTQYKHLIKSDVSMLRTMAWLELINTFSWKRPINNLKIIRRLIINLIQQQKITKDYGINTEYQSFMELRQKLFYGSCKEMLNNCQIDDFRFHENAGCHLSMMSGGYKQWVKFKIENFAHSECSQSLSVENIQEDIYIDMKKFISQQLNNNLYDFNNVDMEIPYFIRKLVPEFPFLLLPKELE